MTLSIIFIPPPSPRHPQDGKGNVFKVFVNAEGWGWGGGCLKSCHWSCPKSCIGGPGYAADGTQEDCLARFFGQFLATSSVCADVFVILPDVALCKQGHKALACIDVQKYLNTEIKPS